MDQDKKVIATEAMKALSEIEDSMKTESLVKDNKIEFSFEDIKYRIRKPNFDETVEIEEAKRKKYVEYIKDDSYMFRKQWIDSYKKKGIDVEQMEKQATNAKLEMEQIMLRLATSQEPRTIQELKSQILKLKDEQYSVSMQITDLLTYSIEDQMNMYSTSYLAFLVFEKQVVDKWEKVFTNYKEFINSSTKPVHMALYYISFLMYS